jgi:hypothetical protein
MRPIAAEVARIAAWQYGRITTKQLLAAGRATRCTPSRTWSPATPQAWVHDDAVLDRTAAMQIGCELDHRRVARATRSRFTR